MRVFREIVGNACRWRVARHARRARNVVALDARNPLLDVAHGVQIFVELPAVGASQRALPALGFVQRDVENALSVASDALPAVWILFIVCGPEHPIEDRPRPDLRRIRRVLGAPREAVAVGAAVPVVAVPALNALFAAELERPEPRVPYEVL